MNSGFFNQGWLRLNSLVTQVQHKLAKGGLPAKTPAKFTQRCGCVYLIGAGTGDVELLTVKAYRLLQQADIVLYDWLANKEILEILPATTETVFVGKRAGHHSISQEGICQLLTEHALKGKRVVRLKGGDPSIFGRLNEETRALAQDDIPFAIVPGITAASGCAAYSGIQLTERDCSQSVRFITAQFKNPDTEPDWKNLASSRDTLVFYMGLNRIAKIAARLVSHGMDKQQPMAIIDQGTTAEQKVCYGELGNIHQQSLWQSFSGPALIIIGEVVNKRQKVTLPLLANGKSSTKLKLN